MADQTARSTDRATARSMDIARLLIACAVFWICFQHGGYSVVERDEIGVVVWWAVLFGSITGLLRIRSTFGLSTLVALTGLSLVELVSMLWSHDADSAVGEFDRVLVYAGVLVLTIGLVRAVSPGAVVDGIGLGVSVVAVLSLSSRFFPDIGSSRMTSTFLQISNNRLSYPLDYWNGLAILMAIGWPLLLWRASAADVAWRRAIAGGLLPLLPLVVYLSSSRGGAVALVVGTVVFLAGTHLRWRVLASLAVAGIATSICFFVIHSSHALVNGPLRSAAARHDGWQAAMVVFVVCGGAGLAQFVLARHEPSQPRSFRALGRALSIAAVVAIALGVLASSPVERVRQFTAKPTIDTRSPQFVQQHFLTANGNGRWQQWSAAVGEWESAPIVGRGAGSYYRWWLVHGTLPVQVRNAHSLYLETLGELGVLGFVLLLAALLPGAISAARQLRGRAQWRPVVAACLGGYSAFLVGAAVDWIWQLAAVGTVGIALLGVLVSRRSVVAWPPVVIGGLGAFAALVLVVSISSELRLDQSFTAAGAGHTLTALRDAAAARKLEPWSTAPRLQLALLEERRGNLQGASAAIDSAIARDGGDWQLWLVKSRVSLELGKTRVARVALDSAARLNPRSDLFFRLHLK